MKHTCGPHTSINIQKLLACLRMSPLYEPSLELKMPLDNVH